MSSSGSTPPEVSPDGNDNGGGHDAAGHGAHGHDGHGHGGSEATLALGALGIVYGDIGTSPLYAYCEAFEGHHLEVTRDGVLGASPLVVWALIIVITIKYLALVMRADNKGEGGILAFTSLLGRSVPRNLLVVLTTMGILAPPCSTATG
ncbi:MAG: KUP/HAK/KT family potassium transporter [Acidimicrobiales bacterium]